MPDNLKTFLRRFGAAGIGMIFSITFASLPIISWIESMYSITNLNVIRGVEKNGVMDNAPLGVSVMIIVGILIGILFSLLSDVFYKKEIKLANYFLVGFGYICWIFNFSVLIGLIFFRSDS